MKEISCIEYEDLLSHLCREEEYLEKIKQLSQEIQNLKYNL
jgi:hypothetical protein